MFDHSVVFVVLKVSFHFGFVVPDVGMVVEISIQRRHRSMLMHEYNTVVHLDSHACESLPGLVKIKVTVFDIFTALIFSEIIHDTGQYLLRVTYVTKV